MKQSIKQGKFESLNLVKNKMKIKTSLSKRGSSNSFITTVPRNLLFLRGIDVTKEKVKVLWDIDLKTGKFIVDFEKVEEKKK
jgi:hypothetical protein